MGVELFQGTVDEVAPIVVVDAVEGITCSVHRQCGHIETLGTWESGRDT